MEAFFSFTCTLLKDKVLTVDDIGDTLNLKKKKKVQDYTLISV